jgi:hypothetical protein
MAQKKQTKKNNAKAQARFVSVGKGTKVVGKMTDAEYAAFMKKYGGK